jgi:protein-disulfide isomerase
MKETTMQRGSLSSALFTTVAGLILLWPHSSRAEAAREQIEAIVSEYLASHPDQVGEIVKGYLIKNPDVLREVFSELVRRGAPAKTGANATASAGARTGVERRAAVTRNAEALFNSTHQVTLGNPGGDVTLVEFFDYSCGFCKRALNDMLTLIQDDPKLKIVLKEFPILGPGSTEAARVAIAARMQDPGGQKYLGFHRELLSSPGPASKDRALAAARDQGFDMARLEQDLASNEVRTTLEENMKLAGALGLSGTPGYVIGNTVVLGAVGLGALRTQIGSARTHQIE